MAFQVNKPIIIAITANPQNCNKKKRYYRSLYIISLDPRPIRLQLNARSPPRPGIDCISGRDRKLVSIKRTCQKIVDRVPGKPTIQDETATSNNFLLFLPCKDQEG